MSNLGGLHSPRPVSYMQQHGSQGASYNLFNQYQAQNQAVRGLTGSTPYADTPPPMSVSGATSLGPSTPGVNSVTSSFYGSGPLSGSTGFGGGMGGLSLGNGAGVGLGGVLGAGSTSIPSQLAVAHHQQQQEENKIYQLVIDLLDVNTREAALLELSKKREQYDDLALVLWHSFGMLRHVL